MNSKTQLLVFTLFLCGFPSLAQIEHTEIDINYTGVKHLIVKGNFCDVNIKGVDGEEAFVKGNASDLNLDYIRIEHSFAQGVLEIWVESRERNLNFGNYNRPKGNINIRVPFNCRVVAYNVSGDLNAENLTAKSLSLKSRSGNVEATNLTANLRINSDYGDISVNGLNGELSGKTNAGKQKFQNIVGSIYTISKNGDVEISNSLGLVNVLTTSGEISLTNTEGMVTLKTDSGDINGKSILVKQSADVKSESGDVNLDLSNELSDASFSLKSRKGKLNIGEHESKKELILFNGKIKIQGVSEKGNQKYY